MIVKYLFIKDIPVERKLNTNISITNIDDYGDNDLRHAIYNKHPIIREKNLKTSNDLNKSFSKPGSLIGIGGSGIASLAAKDARKKILQKYIGRDYIDNNNSPQ